MIQIAASKSAIEGVNPSTTIGNINLVDCHNGRLTPDLGRHTLPPPFSELEGVGETTPACNQFLTFLRVRLINQLYPF
jgi:hypothetical protein